MKNHYGIKVKIISFGFFVVVISVFFVFTKFSVADNICAPNSGYLFWWSGSWTSSMVPMSSSTKYALVNSPIYVSPLGNVGIGTMNPNYKLQVNGTTSADQFCIIPITGPVSCINSWATGTITVSGSPSSNQVAFWTGTSSISGYNNFVWNASTRSLGIGTTSPQANLHINGTTTADQFLGKFNASNIRPGTFGDIINMSTSTYSFIGSVAIETTTIPSTTSLYAKNYIRSDRGFCIGDSCIDSWAVNYWALTGNTLYPASTSWNVAIGTTTIDSTYQHKLQVAGTVGITNGGLVIGNTPQRGNWNSRVPLNNVITTVDSDEVDNVGLYNSITIGSDGLPIISYFVYYPLWNRLRVAKCNDLYCMSKTTTIIATSSGTMLSSITIAPDGYPIIAFTDGNIKIAKIAKCNNLSCSSPTVTPIESNAGGRLSITIAPDGYPIISYYYGTNTLRVAKCNDIYCSTKIITTIDSGSQVGSYSSIAIGSDGLPIISYYGNYSLRVAKCNNSDCTNKTTTTVDAGNSSNQVGTDNSITIAPDGLPIISYYTTTSLRVAKCNDLSCFTKTTTTVDSDVNNIGIIGNSSSITIGPDGLPIISYYYYTSMNLRVAKCNDLSCLTKTIITVDKDYSTGKWSSIAIGSDGLPVIAYHQSTDGILRVAKCGSENCIPYWSRR
jgi:hypothetical protein